MTLMGRGRHRAPRWWSRQPVGVRLVIIAAPILSLIVILVALEAGRAGDATPPLTTPVVSPRPPRHPRPLGRRPHSPHRRDESSQPTPGLGRPRPPAAPVDVVDRQPLVEVHGRLRPDPDPPAAFVAPHVRGRWLAATPRRALTLPAMARPVRGDGTAPPRGRPRCRAVIRRAHRRPGQPRRRGLLGRRERVDGSRRPPPWVQE